MVTVHRLALVIFLVLIGSFVWGWSQFSSSTEPKPNVNATTRSQLTAPANSDDAGTGNNPAVTSNTEAVTPDTRSGRLTDAAFTRHINQLKSHIKDRASASAFSIVIQKPFVVIGDESPKKVQHRSNTTVRWAVDRLKQDFFTKDPSNILNIWLFKDDASYRKHTQVLFGETPSTPFGYYSPAHKALIMNIGTGGGTLVHEIVHPFMEANFPACPPWLNEGLGSLYEQTGEVDGHIYGYTNWRLPGLQEAIKSQRVPSFAALTAMDSSAFYNEARGTNYAAARYLCYYLQEKGLLVKFYREFLAKQKTDPTGFKSLKAVLAEPDMDAFKVRWEQYVMGLKQGYDVRVD